MITNNIKRYLAMDSPYYEAAISNGKSVYTEGLILYYFEQKLVSDIASYRPVK